MTKFEKPSNDERDYPEMVEEAVLSALQDAGLIYEHVQQACAGYVYGESTSGQRALYSLGLTGIPIYNVNNNCATGSTALRIAKNLIESGSNCVLAVGFERMKMGALQFQEDDCAHPLDAHLACMKGRFGTSNSPLAPQMFGNAGREHMERYGTTADHFVKVAHKNHRHSVNNPRAQFQKEYSMGEIYESPMIHDPLTRLQCSPTSNGAAAAILVSEDFLGQRSPRSEAIRIEALEMVSDPQETFANESAISVVGAEMTKRAAHLAYESAAVGPEDVDVIELHDCFSTNELITYEALGLCGEGEGGTLIDSGDVTYGGRWVVNPSGGLISKGHPLGATGIAQCAEINWHLRGEAGRRQVEDAKIGLQHNVGLGGAAVVGIYRLMNS